MDDFLLVLLLIVLTPLIIREYRRFLLLASRHGGALLDYLDRANAPLALRSVLRWGVGPLDWLAKQLNREKAIEPLIEVPEMTTIEDEEVDKP